MNCDGNATPMSVEGEYAVNTLIDLVRIDSINPSLANGTSGGRILADAERAHGYCWQQPESSAAEDTRATLESPPPAWLARHFIFVGPAGHLGVSDSGSPAGCGHTGLLQLPVLVRFDGTS